MPFYADFLNVDYNKRKNRKKTEILNGQTQSTGQKLMDGQLGILCHIGTMGVCTVTILCLERCLPIAVLEPRSVGQGLPNQ